MKSFRTIKKNAKALSPVVASIILIAVTVAVSVVVAAWMGGMSIGLMGNAEQATITNLDFSTAGEITVTIQNTGNAQVVITNAYVNTASVTNTFTDPIIKGGTDSQALTFVWAANTEYTVKLTTSKGNNLVLTAMSPSAVPA